MPAQGKPMPAQGNHTNSPLLLSDLPQCHSVPRFLHTFGAMSSKRRRLSAFGQRAQMSMRGLEEVLSQVGSAPPAHSRRTQRRARQGEAMQQTAFGELAREYDFEYASGGVIKLYMQHPLAILSWALQRSPSIASLFKAAWEVRAAAPDSRYHVIIYCDEVNCGNPLSHVQRRKVQTVYWSLEELGPAAMGQELSWFEAISIRSHIVRDLKGGMSQILGRVLKELFSSDGANLGNGAVFEVLGCGFCPIFAKLGTILADTPALCEVYGSRGASSTKPCALCRNVVSLRSRLADHMHDELLPLTSLNIPSMKVHTNRSLPDMCRHLREQKTILTPTDHETLCQDHGWHDLAYNFILDAGIAFDAVSVFMFDWMHMFLQTGCFNHESWGLLLATQAFHGPRQCFDMVQAVQVPKAMPTLKHLLADKHMRSCTEAGVLKCTASEGLTLYPIIRQWCRRVLLPAGSATVHAESFLLLANVLDLLNGSRKGMTLEPDHLAGAIMAWLQKHQEAYGDSLWKPKSHFALHLPSMLRRRRYLFACWVHERHHKVIKRSARNRFTAASFEKGLVEDVIHQKCYHLEHDHMHQGIQNRRLASPDRAKEIRLAYNLPPDESVYVGASVVVHGAPIHVGDVVLCVSGRLTRVGVVENFMATASLGDIAQVKMWRFLSEHQDEAHFMTDAEEVLNLPLHDLLEALMASAHGRVRHAFLPAHWATKYQWV